MNPHDKNLVIEQAKTLALTISLLNTKYDKLLGEFNSKLSEVYLQLKSEVNTSKDTLDFIAQNVAYQSNLDETKFELNTFVKGIHSSLTNYSTIHEHPYAIDSHGHDEVYSNLIHEHDYTPTDTHNRSVARFNSKLDTYYTLSNYSIKLLSEMVVSNYETIVASLETSNNNLDEITKTLARDIDNVAFKLDTFKSNTKKDINDLSDIIDNVKTQYKKDITKALDDLSNRIDDEFDRVDSTLSNLSDVIETATDDIEAVLDDIDTTLSKVNLQLIEHQDSINTITNDLASQHEEIVDDNIKILSSIDVIQDRQDTLEDSIDIAISLIKTKPEYSEILLKEDLEKLKQDIIDAVPVPKDGKNASEWQFRPHPTRKGILIFKKDTDKNWNHIDLNHIVPKAEEYEQNQAFSFIGGGGGSSGYPILWNNVLISSNSSINFIGTAVTSVTDINNIVTVRVDVGTGSTAGLLTYNKSLTGTHQVIPYIEHGINTIVNFYIKKNINGKIINVSESELGGNITLDSNVDLFGCTLYILGYV